MLVRHEGQDDFVKVLDFGLALISRHLNSGDESEEHNAKTAPKITQVGEIFGTPSYMAPEQTVSAATDIRTDLYAVGILLYEMLTGQRPFVGKNPVAIIQQQLVTPPPPMNDRAPEANIPPDLEALVMRLLAKQPAQRFQTPDELIAAIDQLAAAHNLALPGSVSSSGHAIVSPEAAKSKSAPKPKSKSKSKEGQALDEIQKRLAKGSGSSRLVWAVGAGVLILLLLGALWMHTKRQQSAEPPQDAEAPQPAAAPPKVEPQSAADSAPARRGAARHRPKRSATD